MQAKIHIVIVNWNSGDWLRRCVASIVDHGSGLVDRVVVVDNGSTDGSAEFGPSTSPPELVATGANLGFARASNLGAGGAVASFLLFLNPDAALGGDTLRRALAFMEGPEAAGVAVCGIRLVDEDGGTQRHCARFPTARTFLGSATGLSGLFPRLFPPLLMEDFDHLESRRVDHVIGAFYLVRRELFESSRRVRRALLRLSGGSRPLAARPRGGLAGSLSRRGHGLPQGRRDVRAGQGTAALLCPAQPDSLRLQAFSAPPGLDRRARHAADRAVAAPDPGAGQALAARGGRHASCLLLAVARFPVHAAPAGLSSAPSVIFGYGAEQGDSVNPARSSAAAGS